MSLKLVKGSNEYKTQIIDMLEEWIDYNSKNETNRSPWAIFKNSYDNFDYYLNHLETSEPKDGLVPDSTFFCLDEERNIMVGAVNIRHYLNEHLLAHGGHIGDGIRPSERRKGYATQMIKLALEECKKLGIQKVLMVCDKENIGSAKSIIKNGGVLENELLENGKIEQRYWIELQNRFVSKYLIDKGWSGDKKYCVTDEQGNKFLLRVSPIEQYKRKKSEYELMQQVAALGVPMCKPLEFGVSDDGVFSIQSWINGVDAEENVQNLTSEEQYSYGFEAGRILKEIHRVPAPEGIEDWEIYFNRKADRKIKMYEECPVKYENGQAFIDYINEHRHLLSGRPQTYQHGDYHIGNMMIGNDKRLYIIDFNRNDFGDPWEEFNRIVWCAQSTPLFATGMVNGYFDNNVPMEFWELLALYISSNTLSSVPWAIPFGDEQVQVMVNQAKDVLSWYDNMKNPVPNWYKGVE